MRTPYGMKRNPLGGLVPNAAIGKLQPRGTVSVKLGDRVAIIRCGDAGLTDRYGTVPGQHGFYYTDTDPAFVAWAESQPIIRAEQ